MPNDISKLILGTAQLGMPYGINNPVFESKSNRLQVLTRAMELGIRQLDTAEGYGDSQKLIGEFHSANKERFSVQTKFKDNDICSLQDSLLNDLTMLQVDQLECYMFHAYHDVDQHALIDGLLQLKEKGKIKKIGVSIYDNDQFSSAIAKDWIDVIQIPFNILDHWQKRGELIRKAKLRHKEIQVRSVFLQGIFFRNPVSLPNNLKPLGPSIASIQEFCSKAKVGIPAVALNYAFQFEQIDKIVIGVNDAQQLQANVNLLQTKIPPALFSDLEKVDAPEDLLDPRNWK